MKKFILTSLIDDDRVAVKDYLEAIRFYYHLIRQSMGVGVMQ
jgi:hypothetical protein